MQAVRTSETLVNFNVTTQRYISEDSKLHLICSFPIFLQFPPSGLMDGSNLMVNTALTKLCIKDFCDSWSQQSQETDCLSVYWNKLPRKFIMSCVKHFHSKQNKAPSYLIITVKWFVFFVFIWVIPGLNFS
jgi:hypothetical protein